MKNGCVNNNLEESTDMELHEARLRSLFYQIASRVRQRFCTFFKLRSQRSEEAQSGTPTYEYSSQRQLKKDDMQCGHSRWAHQCDCAPPLLCKSHRDTDRSRVKRRQTGARGSVGNKARPFSPAQMGKPMSSGKPNTHIPQLTPSDGEWSDAHIHASHPCFW